MLSDSCKNYLFRYSPKSVKYINRVKYIAIKSHNNYS